MPDTLLRGQQLSAGQELVGTDGNCKLSFQQDGNLVIYALTPDGRWRVVWSPQIEGKGGVTLVQQDDGNLVVYTASGHPVWANNCDGKAIEKIVMQNDENLVSYGYDVKPRWATDTYNSSPYSPGTCADLKKELKHVEEGGALSGTVGKPPPDRDAVIARLRRLISAKGC